MNSMCDSYNKSRRSKLTSIVALQVILYKVVLNVLEILKCDPNVLKLYIT